MTVPVATAFRDVHDATLALLQASDESSIWQAVLGHGIGLVRGHGGSVWVPEGGALRRIMVGGTDALARAESVLAGEEQLRLSAGDDESQVVAREVRTADRHVVAVIRICRPLADAPLDESTREAYAALIEVAGLVATTMRREADLKAKARDFTLVAELSREVTATLDLDRVLRAVVNLSAKALTFDRGALALYEDGRCDIRAVAGADTVQADDPRIQDLAVRAAWAAGRGSGLYVSDRDDPASDAERVFLQFFAADLEADDTRSGLYIPLRDEEGIVGVLVLESAQPEFASDHARAVVDILANQATVAIRNARLYSQVPLVDMLGAIGERRRAFRALPKRRKQLLALGVFATLAAFTLIRWPLRVDGASPALLPHERAIVRASLAGRIDQVQVRPGQRVVAADPLMVLRDEVQREALDLARADLLIAEREAALGAAGGDAVAERLARIRAGNAQRRAMLAQAELEAMTIRAPSTGVILSEQLDDLTGRFVQRGESLLLLGRTDSLEVVFDVSQQEIARVRSGQSVGLRVAALPQRTFTGRVVAVSPLPTDSETSWNLAAIVPASAEASFRVRAIVANPDNALRPGMTPFIRVMTAPASLAERLLRVPLRSLRILWWKITA